MSETDKKAGHRLTSLGYCDWYASGKVVDKLIEYCKYNFACIVLPILH